jgi:hypothetical protein
MPRRRLQRFAANLKSPPANSVHLKAQETPPRARAPCPRPTGTFRPAERRAGWPCYRERPLSQEVTLPGSRHLVPVRDGVVPHVLTQSRKTTKGRIGKPFQADVRLKSVTDGGDFAKSAQSRAQRCSRIVADRSGGNPVFLGNIEISQLRSTIGSRLRSAGGQKTQRKPTDQHGREGQAG